MSLPSGEFSGTLVPPGTCLVHGSYTGSACPTCSSAALPFAGQPYHQQPTSAPIIPSVDQRRWQTCPVCAGKGLVPNGFYSAPGMPAYPATSTMPEQCRACSGRGIVR